MTETSEGVQASDISAPVIRTFLIADVRGYTAFTNEQGVPAAARLADRFAVLCQATVRAYDGEVVELRGDEALAVFPSSRSALVAAVALQGRFQQEMADDPGLPLQVGMGIDVGEVMPIQGGYRGKALNLAARLCSLAGPTEVFASEEVIIQAERVDGLAYVERGRVQLKGFSEPIRVIHVLPQEDLPENFPPLVSLIAKPSNLPLQTTPFIGRVREIDEVAKLILREEVRLVTLTGAGGTGKTRLSLQVGGTVLEHFERGVFFVNLASLTEPALVPPTIASTLKVRAVQEEEILTALVGYLQDRELLLVLDNFEHLLDAAETVHQLLVACPPLKILVTSRIPLHLSAEHEYRVPPLGVPDPQRLPTLEELTQYDAVAFFIERARAVRSDFRVTNENAPAVAEICSQLDGLPLAIELAAARVKLFPPRALLQRLSSRLTLLTGGPRDRPTRQQTLRGAIDWSYSLLTEEEQVLFARLSVFLGGCTFEAAEQVCGPTGELNVLEGMASLVDKSLVRQEGEEPRLSLLETIREYAAEKLEERGEEETIQEAHAGYWLALSEEAKPFLDRRVGKAWLARLAPERDNIRLAFSWLLNAGKHEKAARLTTALWGFWGSSAHGSMVEGRQQLEAVLATPDLSGRVRSAALLRLCYFAKHQGALDRVQEAAEEALAIAQDIGDAGTEFRALASQWDAAMVGGNREEASALYDRCIRLVPQTSDPDITAQALRMQGFLAMENGDFARAGQLFAEEVALRRKPEVAGDVHGALVNVGWVALERGDLDTAEAAYAENATPVGGEGLAYVALERGEYDAALRRFGEIVPRFFEEGMLLRLASCFEGIAQVAAAQGRPALAAFLLGAAEALYGDLGQAHERRATDQARLELARSAVDEQAWATEYKRGRELPLEDAVHLALEYSGKLAG